jgi:hypothetical protein
VPEVVEPPPPQETRQPCAESRECAARLGHGSVCVAGRCAEYLDRSDLRGLFFKEQRDALPERDQLYLTAIPAIGFSPSSGFLLGAVATAGLYLGDPKDTTISNGTGVLLGTTKKQLIFQLTTTVLTPRNDWELLGDLRVLLFNQDTYGLGGNGTPLRRSITINGWGTTEAIPGAQPMNFDLVRIHENVLRKVIGAFYLGGGYHLDRYFGIEDLDLDLSADPKVLTSHYAYSWVEGFDPAAYTVSGVSLDVLSDARDSTIAPYRGWYLHLSYGWNPTWLGSTKDSTTLSGEARYYLSLSDEVPRNVLAFWVRGSGVMTGAVPYLALPAIGWDARSTSGRGYVQGRFRGTATLYAEAEWRFRIGESGMWGGTLFVNASTFSRPAANLPQYGFTEPGESLFETVRPAGGVGLRIMIDRRSRTNLRIDLAGGVDSFAFYLGAGEAF